jgi:S-adenosylmethionine synthetase
MPPTHFMATRLEKTLTDMRKSSELGWLQPGGKTQVTIEYLWIGSFPAARRAIHGLHERKCVLDSLGLA